MDMAFSAWGRWRVNHTMEPFGVPSTETFTVQNVDAKRLRKEMLSTSDMAQTLYERGLVMSKVL